jgi:hypothetical protein
MGTIRNPLEAQKAYEAGAMFIVTPNADSEVIEVARTRGIPVYTGPGRLELQWLRFFLAGLLEDLTISGNSAGPLIISLSWQSAV